MKPRVGDFLIAAVIILAAVCIWIIPFSAETGEFATVKINGETVSVLDLRGGESCREFNGVTVCAGKGHVYVKDADCPDKVCVKTGTIKKAGQSVVCIPNRVSVSIEGTEEIDGIAGGQG